MSKLYFLLRRAGYAALTLLGLSLLLFVLLRMMPGGPAQAILGLRATPEQIERINAEYGFDRPILVQYLDYIGKVLTGDWGQSILFRRPVIDVVASALPVTIALAAYVVILSIVFTTVLAVLAAKYRGRFIDSVVRAVPLLGIGLPVFWVGLMLLFAFALAVPIFPAGGLKPGVLGWLESLFLPAAAMTISISAILVRSLRRALIDVMDSDYVLTARASGIRGARLWTRHILPNAAIPTLTLLALVFVALLGGSLVVESVFAIPGVGKLLVQGFNSYDVPLVMGIVLATGILILVVNIAMDLIYTIIDPRVAVK